MSDERNFLSLSSQHEMTLYLLSFVWTSNGTEWESKWKIRSSERSIEIQFGRMKYGKDGMGFSTKSELLRSLGLLSPWPKINIWNGTIRIRKQCSPTNTCVFFVFVIILHNPRVSECDRFGICNSIEWENWFLFFFLVLHWNMNMHKIHHRNSISITRITFALDVDALATFKSYDNLHRFWLHLCVVFRVRIFFCWFVRWIGLIF